MLQNLGPRDYFCLFMEIILILHVWVSASVSPILHSYLTEMFTDILGYREPVAVLIVAVVNIFITKEFWTIILESIMDSTGIYKHINFIVYMWMNFSLSGWYYTVFQVLFLAYSVLGVYDTQKKPFLNQARTWFLKVVSVQMSVYVCVCVCPPWGY